MKKKTKKERSGTTRRRFGGRFTSSLHLASSYARETSLAYGWDGEIWEDNQKRKAQRAYDLKTHKW